MIPITRRMPIRSLKNRTAPKVINTGLISMIAVASAKPMFEIPQKKHMVAHMRKTERAN